jgi:predicted nucleotidyltransferase
MKAGELLNQRTLAKLLHVSPTAIGKAIPGLAKEQLITVKKDPSMKLTLISLNRENHKAIEKKRTENLSLLYSTGMVDALEDAFPGTIIILFGSYAFGEDTVKSDIDIAVIGSKEKPFSHANFEKKLERPITLHCYKKLSDVGKELQANFMNGIVLVGRIPP